MPLRRLAVRHETLCVEVVDPRELELPDVGVLELRRPRDRPAPRDPDRRPPGSGPATRRRPRPRAGAGLAAAFRAAGADHLVLRTDRDWLADLVAFVATRRERAAAAGPERLVTLPRTPTGCGCCSASPRWSSPTSCSSCGASHLRRPLHQPRPARRRRPEAPGLAPPRHRRRVRRRRSPLLVVALAEPARDVEVPRRAGHGRCSPSTSRSRWRPPTSSPAGSRRPRTPPTEFLDTVPDTINVGLVEFAGGGQRASCRRRPTTATCARAIDDLELAEGTAIGEAIFASLDALDALPEADDPDEAVPATIIVMSDGETTVGRPNAEAVDAALERRRAGVDDRLRHRGRAHLHRGPGRARAARPRRHGRRSPRRPAASSSRPRARASWRPPTRTSAARSASRPSNARSPSGSSAPPWSPCSSPPPSACSGSPGSLDRLRYTCVAYTTWLSRRRPASDDETFGIDPAIYHRRWLILGTLCISLVMIVVAVSSLNVALPSIQESLGASGTELQWIVDAYALVFAGMLLPAGALGDRFGRKGALQFGLVVFGVAVLVASMANDPSQLIAARTVMGVGAAFIMPSTLSIVMNSFPFHERPKAIAIWAAFAGVGGALGPISSGLLLEHFWWGAVFFINVPLVALLLGLSVPIVPTSKDPERPPPRPDRRAARSRRPRVAGVRRHRRPGTGLDRPD